jgi:hypothetical protein
MQEDFFDLGGTSVQVARIFARIEEVFHERLPLSVIWITRPGISALTPIL